MDADHHAGLFLRRQRGHGRVQIGDRLIDLPLPDLRIEDAAREGLEFACDQIEQLAEIGGVKGLRRALLRRWRKGIGCQVLHQTLLVFRIGNHLIEARTLIGEFPDLGLQRLAAAIDGGGWQMDHPGIDGADLDVAAGNTFDAEGLGHQVARQVIEDQRMLTRCDAGLGGARDFRAAGEHGDRVDPRQGSDVGCKRRGDGCGDETNEGKLQAHSGSSFGPQPVRIEAVPARRFVGRIAAKLVY